MLYDFEECRLSVFKNRILRRKSVTKRGKDGEWKRLHSEEIHNLYHSSNTVRMIKSRILRRTGQVARMEEVMRTFKILTGKRRGNKLSGRLRDK